MRRAVAVLLAVWVGIVGAAAAPGAGRSVALAQESSDPPALGAVVLQDGLAGTGPFRPRACPSGRSASEFVEAGLQVRVNGRCTDANRTAFFVVVANGLTAAHGDVAVEVKVTEGRERGWVELSFRDQPNGDAYFFSWLPSQNRVELHKAIGSVSAQLAENANFAELDPDAWTRLSVRFAGPRIWAFVNDQLVMTATDPSLVRGGFTLDSGRFGNVEDDDPTTVIWRSLQVTALADEPAAAAPARPGDAGAAPASGSAAAGSGTSPASAAPASLGVPAGPPPGVGEVVHQEPLTEAGIIPTGTCPTGNGRGEVVAEGFLMALKGKCTAQSRSVSVLPPLAGLTVPDGEIRFEVKITGGYDRATISLVSRMKRTAVSGYYVSLAPSSGLALMAKLGQDAGSPLLARRGDLVDLFRRDDWNTIAFRLVGPSLWLIVNDQPVLMAEDGAYESGGASLGISRSGSADDEDEVAVVFRNITISKMDGAPDDHAPTYQRPSGPPGQPSVLSLRPVVR
jgi:hypothetical protein